MKILVGMPSKDSWGGPIACEPPFTEALRKLGHAVSEEIYVFGENGLPTSHYDRIRRVVNTAFRFRKLLKNNDFDIIQLNTAFDLKTILRDSFSLFWMKPGKTKVFFKLHGSDADSFKRRSFPISFLINYLKRKGDGFGVLSSEEKENFIGLGFPEAKLYQVKNVVTNNGIYRSKKDEDTKTQFFEITYVSRFIRTKGLIETIRACSLLQKNGFSFRLKCLGDGEIIKEAQIEAARLNLGKSIVFTGYVSEEEVNKRLLETDLFVFPTRHAEGFPMVVFKAVSLGIPIVTTKIRAMADYLEDSENCLFCTQEPADIAEKLAELIGNDALGQIISGNNIELGKTLLPEVVAREFIEIYQSILKS